MKLGITSIVLIAGLSVSCSSGNTEPISLNVDGTYDISAVATTELDVNGGTCGDASGALMIDNSEISGSVLSTNGHVFDLSGSVTSSGVVTGGFAQSGQSAASFEGAFSGDRASGTWSDVFECVGTWEAITTP